MDLNKVEKGEKRLPFPSYPDASTARLTKAAAGYVGEGYGEFVIKAVLQRIDRECPFLSPEKHSEEKTDER